MSRGTLLTYKEFEEDCVCVSVGMECVVLPALPSHTLVNNYCMPLLPVAEV